MPALPWGLARYYPLKANEGLSNSHLSGGVAARAMLTVDIPAAQSRPPS
jgi:hypothetical protein